MKLAEWPTIGGEVDEEDRNGSALAPMKQRVALNDEALLICEEHQLVRLTDAQVRAIRDAYEAGVDGTGPKIGYRALAKQYGMGKRTIRDILNYKRRIKS